MDRATRNQVRDRAGRRHPGVSPALRPVLKALVRRCLPPSVVENRRRLAELDLIEANLRLGVPGRLKGLFIRNAARVLRCPTFVESGTFTGDMALYAAGLFESVHTIELQPDLAARASERLKETTNLTVHQGDSPTVLRALLRSLSTPVLFWLDAHYSGGETARGEKDTPILEELAAVRDGRRTEVAVLIDDARVFGMDAAYPSLEAAIALLREINPRFHIGVAQDIIWASPVRLLDFEWRVGPSGGLEIAPMDG